MIKGNNIKVTYGGGLNTSDGPLGIGEDQSPNCKNVHSNMAGALILRPGSQTVNATTIKVGTTGNGLFDYWKDANTHYMIAYKDTSLYKMDVSGSVFDGTFDTLTFAGTAMSDAVMEFETFNDAGTNYLIMATHDRDKLQKYNGSATSDMSADADAPKGKYIKVWKNRLFVANIANYESRIHYNTNGSAIKDDDDWKASEYYDIQTYDGDYISGLALLKGRLYVFKRYSIHRFTYYGGTPLFSVKQVISGVGTIASKSICNISHPTMGEILVFLGADGRVYAFDGSQIAPISANIEGNNVVSQFNMTYLNKIYLSGACAVNYKQRHWYMCWVPTTTYNNWVIVWDYHAKNSWWPFTGMDARCCAMAEDAGARKLYFIEDDKYVRKFDTGTVDGASEISALYDSKKFAYGELSVLKQQRFIEFQMKNIGDNEITYARRSDWDTSYTDSQDISCNGGGFILGTSVLGTGTLGGTQGKITKINLPVVNQLEQFRLTSATSMPCWAVYGTDIVVKGKGHAVT